MRILALEPFYGGSHRAFLDGWVVHSRHRWTVLSLTAIHWKWRMRHAPVMFAEDVAARFAAGETWDLLFCSDMLNLAEFLGLVDARVSRLPAVVYFHENQLTYPVRQTEERDYHFAMTNLTTCLAATQVWFNSDFHRRSFLDALVVFLKRMPDFQPTNVIESIRAKSSVHPPGIEKIPSPTPRQPGPLHILWAARWEHDKNPEDFFAALKLLKQNGIKFRVSVIGEQYEKTLSVFPWAREYFHAEIERWGYQPSRDEYMSALQEADVIVSTARHEFFGISVVEALAAGAYPLLPHRLAYPEILAGDETINTDRFFYDGSVDHLASQITELAHRVKVGDLWRGLPDRLTQAVAKFSWHNLAPRMDEKLEDVSRGPAM